jgi:hypothetical protein
MSLALLAIIVCYLRRGVGVSITRLDLSCFCKSKLAGESCYSGHLEFKFKNWRLSKMSP